MFVKASVDLEIGLGNLVKNHVYEEQDNDEDADLNQLAFFKTRIGVRNALPSEMIDVAAMGAGAQGDDADKEAVLITLARPVIMVQSVAFDKAVVIWMNYKNAYDYWQRQRAGFDGEAIDAVVRGVGSTFAFSPYSEDRFESYELLHRHQHHLLPLLSRSSASSYYFSFPCSSTSSASFTSPTNNVRLVGHTHRRTIYSSSIVFLNSFERESPSFGVSSSGIRGGRGGASGGGNMLFLQLTVDDLGICLPLVNDQQQQRFSSTPHIPREKTNQNNPMSSFSNTLDADPGGSVGGAAGMAGGQYDGTMPSGGMSSTSSVS